MVRGEAGTDRVKLGRHLGERDEDHRKADRGQDRDYSWGEGGGAKAGERFYDRLVVRWGGWRMTTIKPPPGALPGTGREGDPRGLENRCPERV